MTYILKKWSDVDLDGLSSFVWDNCLTLDKSKISSKEKILEKLQNQKENHNDSYVFIWTEKGEINGVIYLYSESSKYFILTPGFFGQYPIIHKNLEYSSSIIQILKAMFSVLKIQHLEINLIKYELNPECELYKETRSLESSLIDSGMNLFYSKLGLTVENHKIIEYHPKIEVKIERYNPELQDVLYDCYYQTFIHADLEFFNEQSEEERKEFFNELLTPEQINSSASIIVRSHEKVIGFAIIWNYSENSEKNAHLNLMCLLPEFQKQGIGKLILNNVLIRIKEQNIPTLTLYTENDRSPYYFYIKYGFKEAKGWKTFTWIK